MSLRQLIELHELAKAHAEGYLKRRDLFDTLESDQGRHFVGIAGPRGAGKTILLRQYALSHKDAFYLSADSLDPDDDLWKIVGDLHTHYGYQTFLLDEIHFLRDHARLLKRLYDFRDIRVIFTSSVALAMQASAHDLSRRVHMRTLYPFSYREYVRFRKDVELPRITLADLTDRRWTPEHLRMGHLFDEYLRGGLLPFSLEEPEPLPLLQNTIDKIIAKDIPSVARLAVEELETIHRLLRFVGRSGVDGINYSSVSANLGITKYKAEQYICCLEKAFVLHQVFPAGTNVLKEPKVLMSPPCRLLHRTYEDAIGGLREDFFAEAAKQAGIKFHYLKSTRGAKTPNFLIDDSRQKLVIEIGGKGKGREQFKGITIDRKLVLAHTDTPTSKQIPLFLLGYLA
jgi:predicted AAA+ superfamily ATPase